MREIESERDGNARGKLSEQVLCIQYNISLCISFAIHSASGMQWANWEAQAVWCKRERRRNIMIVKTNDCYVLCPSIYRPYTRRYAEKGSNNALKGFSRHTFRLRPGHISFQKCSWGGTFGARYPFEYNAILFSHVWYRINYSQTCVYIESVEMHQFLFFFYRCFCLYFRRRFMSIRYWLTLMPFLGFFQFIEKH